MIYVLNKRSSNENIKEKYHDCHIFDVTSKGEKLQLSPFYTHSDIPVPILWLCHLGERRWRVARSEGLQA